MKLDPAAFMAEFRAEAAEHLAALNRELLALERNPADLAPVRAMLLAAHTLKGGAAMLDLPGLRDLAHATEDVLARLRDKQQAPDDTTFALLFEAVDALQALTQRSSPGDSRLNGAEAALAERLRQPAARPVPIDARAKASVLLVEDSATVRQLESWQLEAAGFRVEAVSSGDAALERALERHFELIVAGHQLRGLSGPELAAALRHTGVPVILTSSDEVEVRQHEGQTVQAYVRKGCWRQGTLAEVALRLVESKP